MEDDLKDSTDFNNIIDNNLKKYFYGIFTLITVMIYLV